MLIWTKRAMLSLLAFAVAGCAGTTPQLPDTIAEGETSYSYIPLDPLRVREAGGEGCFVPVVDQEGNEYLDLDPARVSIKLLDALPDQAVRLAVASYNSSGNLTFGPATVGVEGNLYQVVLDYISADVVQKFVYIKRTTPAGQVVSVFSGGGEPRADSYSVNIIDEQGFRSVEDFISTINAPFNPEVGDLVTIPVYVGVGLRLTASVQVLNGNVNLSSLGALAAEAQAGNISGSLVVQTLGITGSNVAASLPIPSELNQTTIQNAILALGSIKATIYDESATRITPRVVGIYNPIQGGQQLVNGIISALASSPVEWPRPCE